MAKNNALPPASQPWVRELERRIKELENKSYRTDSKVNVMSNRVMTPKMDLESLKVTEIHVGGDEPQVFEHEVENYSISGNTITASTPPVPVQSGFIMEWEVDVTASVDYIQVSSSLDSEMYEDPEEPTGVLAGEETTYFVDASYMIEDGEDEDEIFNPAPPIVSFTLHNPDKTAFTFTVHAMRMRFIIPGEGGLRITQGGEIFLEDGAGRDRIIQEISDEQAQAIIETADNLADAKAKLQVADDTLRDWDEHRLPALQDELDANRDRIKDAEADLEAAFPSGPFNVGSEIAGSASATLTAAALDAQGKATDAANAARTAAEQFAAGEISDAELRAAQEAERLAGLAADAALDVAKSHADTAAQGAQDAAITAAAADATTKANDAADAAQQAAKAYADGEITDAELRAATDAADKANAARDAAVAAAQTYANTAAGAAETAAITAAQSYADQKKTEAINAAATDAKSKADAAQAAAISAAEEHADLVAQGASTDAIAAAALDAQAKADAAETAAKGHADAQAVAAEQAAKTHATNEAARVKQEALTAAATDAQAKATAAADAAQQAAEEYALAQAEGLSEQALADAKADAKSKADAARDAAITSAQTYADARKNEAIDAAALTAQTKADVAQQAAIDAASTDATTKADAAQAAAIAVADAAMTTADGKNTVTYTDVSTYPGAAPANNPERAKFDMHRNRASQTFTSNGTTYQTGEILAEWMWSGTDWVPVHMGDGMLRSFDVGKLTAGTGNLQTAVIQKLTAQLARLIEVDADKIVTGTIKGDVLDFQTIWAGVANLGRIITKELIATGAVTAEALNIVYTDPESGYSFSLQPEGLTIFDESGSPVIALRADMANYFTIMREGTVVASISPRGDIAGRSVSAAESLRYRGVEMAELLEIPARGVLARSSNFGQSIADVGTASARIAAVSLTTPAKNRNIRISFEGRITGGNDHKKTLFHIRQAATPYVRPTNSSVKDWYLETDGNDDFSLSFTTTVDELTWPYGTQISVGVFAQSQVEGDVVRFHRAGHQQLVIEDLGPVVSTQEHKPYVPASGGGTPTGTMDEHLWREQTVQVQASWVQTYRPDGTKNVHTGSPDRAPRRVWQGKTITASGVIGFPSMMSDLNGATIKRVRLWITNTETHRPEGATARISLHGYTSPPATHSWSTDVPIMEVPFSRGESQAIDIPAQYHAGVQSGLYRGVVFSAFGLGTQYIGAWDGAGATWEVIFER